LVGTAAHAGSLIVDAEGPGLAGMVGAATLAGAALVILVLVAYYGTLAAVRFGVDPDTAAIPLTNSSLDLVGAFTFPTMATT